VSLAFLLTTLIIVATPGTGALYTLAAGLSRGARASIVAAVGCTLGIVPPMVAAITGLAPSSDDLDAPCVRRLFCRARRQTRTTGSVKIRPRLAQPPRRTRVRGATACGSSVSCACDRSEPGVWRGYRCLSAR
jgi:hypothetical protein